MIPTQGPPDIRYICCHSQYFSQYQTAVPAYAGFYFENPLNWKGYYRLIGMNAL